MKKSTKKLLVFWLIALPFLVGWSFYWLRVNKGLDNLSGKSQEIRAIYKIWDKLAQKDGQERSFLVLLQNDMELRPGGGYIGTFGILKIKDGDLVSFETHNTNTFDGRVPDGTPTPYPMPEMLRIKDWKMRDANWFPDWKDSAQKAEYFYHAGQGQEEFEGIIGINTQLLETFLTMTGPIKLENVPEEFKEDNAIIRLEELVEQDYKDIGNTHGERKRIVYDLGMAILRKVKDFSYSQKLELAGKIEEELQKKNIQLYFKDQELESLAVQNKWAGKVESSWENDYLMFIDANLGALKSNHKMKYQAEYVIDLSKEKPTAELTFSQSHTAKEKDWMTKDYQGYLRIYAPKEAWLLNGGDFSQIKFSEEYDKKVFGTQVFTKLGTTDSFRFVYTLSPELKNKPYKLLIQKQSGMKDMPVKIKLIRENGEVQEKEIILDRDQIVEF
ncbi:MAG: DUF4012 domain-containing protein [Patescibacteria group bacterium]